MDECIARGAISQVLAQARASLKHPSRPFTPKTTTRPLFHGDDYRPSSRPSSTYSQDGMECEKPASPTVVRRPTRQSSIRGFLDNQEAADLSMLDGPASHLCTPRTEAVDDGGENIEEPDDEKDSNADNDPSCISTMESVHATLVQLQTFLAAGEMESITLTADKLFHEVHLLRHDDLQNITSRVECAYNACLVALLNTTEHAAPVDVIPLVRSLVACNLVDRSPSTDASLVHACKRLFLESKESINDDRFCTAAIVETLLLVLSPTKHRFTWPSQVCIYVAGVLKNVSGAAQRMVSLLATSGAIQTLTNALSVRDEDGSSAVAQIFVQISEILRNLAVHKRCLKQFWAARTTQALCNLFPRFLKHSELILNVMRVLTKLTLHEAGRNEFNTSSANLSNVLDLMRPTCPGPLLVRLAFVLGNLTATNDRNRKALLPKVPILVETLDAVHVRYLKDDGQRSDEEAPGDILVKLVRLIANTAMHANVGAVLGESPRLVCLLDVLDRATTSTNDEELVLNVLSCITNLSFYATESTSANVITRHRRRLAATLAPFLEDSNDEAVVEAARAFGNLTRFPDVLADMAKEEAIFSLLVSMLDHANRDVVIHVCGVLMNAALDGRMRCRLHETQIQGNIVDARNVLVDLFRRAGLRDLPMSAIVCKVLFNLMLEDTEYASTPPGQLLAATLDELLDAIQDEEQEDEFQSVAKALLRALHR
ncbi:hypothetical protein Ae201684P_008848 [Aphanomyces euteiches]|nr:hypothetical protein Ae201684P_008848 [Aphanomyces euteiches]